jgi:hypothetical protein
MENVFTCLSGDVKEEKWEKGCGVEVFGVSMEVITKYKDIGIMS